MISSQRFVITEESQVGEARRLVQEIARRQGGSETYVGKAALIITELGRNLVRHGGGGEIVVREIQANGMQGLEVLGLDQGPGMKNVAECMRDGYSTNGTAGTGLGSIKRMSDQFEIFTEVGKGTGIWSQFFDGRMPARSPGFEVGGVSVALEGELLCGDAWDVLPGAEGILRVLVADGLGHGPFASEAAREAVAVFRGHPRAALPDALELMNQSLTKTRGAVAAVAEFRPVQKQVVVSGMGNISLRIVGQDFSKSLISENGTLGGNMRKIREHTQPIPSESSLIMHSDGIATNWNLADYPGLVHRAPGLIAGILYRDFKRVRDDSTVVAIRYRP